MNRGMSVSGVMLVLERDIAKKTALLKALVAIVPQAKTRKRAAKQSVTPKRPSLGVAVVDILRAAHRPMHGLREILPALESRGYRVTDRPGLATTILRRPEVERTAPGTYAVRETVVAPLPSHNGAAHP